MVTAVDLLRVLGTSRVRNEEQLTWCRHFSWSKPWVLGRFLAPCPAMVEPRRWDRAAIDQALDRASGLSSLPGAPAANAYDMWSNSRGQG
jgi:hypothetical protein